jgi:hypothetical protein
LQGTYEQDHESRTDRPPPAERVAQDTCHDRPKHGYEVQAADHELYLAIPEPEVLPDDELRVGDNANIVAFLRIKLVRSALLRARA